MYMALGRLGVEQENTGMVVELNQHNRALNAVVERVFISKAADPAEVSLAPMCLYMCHACGKRAIWENTHV